MGMRRRTAVAVTASAMVAAALLAAPAASAADWQDRRGLSSDRSDDLRAYGLSGNGTMLVRFDIDEPEDSRDIGKVAGLSGDTKLIGIDFRVQDGKLYGVGDAGGVYTLSVRDAHATKVSQLTAALQGSAFGVDFNPAADRLRIISDAGQNLRHDVNPGGVTATDTSLTYPPAAPIAMGATAAAYTNNDLDPSTGTTLFDIDSMLDQVAIQAPANAGTLSLTGKLGVDAAADAGFDIYSTVRRGVTVDVEGFAVLNVGGSPRLFEVALLTGRATDQGKFRSAVTDIAIELN